MPVLHVGVIYATVSKCLQRVYVPHADDSEIAQQHVGLGESIFNVPYLTYVNGGAAACQAAIGTPAHSGRCAVVNPSTGAISKFIMADPAIYADPDGHHVIQTDNAVGGDVWNGTTFTRPAV